MGIYEDRQIYTKTGFRPIKLQESRSGPHTDRTPSNNKSYKPFQKSGQKHFWGVMIPFLNVHQGQRSLQYLETINDRHSDMALHCSFG